LPLHSGERLQSLLMSLTSPFLPDYNQLFFP
jgi:hypothetical protein